MCDIADERYHLCMLAYHSKWKDKGEYKEKENEGERGEERFKSYKGFTAVLIVG